MAKTREAGPKPLRAADLIGAAERRSVTRNVPSEDALRELEAVMAHNDRVGRKAGARVTISQAVELLRSHGWRGGKDQFLALVRQQYGRGWEA